MKLTPLATAIALAGMTLSSAAVAGTVTTDGADIKIKTKGGLSVETADGKYSVKVGGRIQYDYNRAEENGEADEDQFDIRRARIFVSGDIQDFSYKAQFNIADGGDFEVDEDDMGMPVLETGKVADEGGTPEDLYIRYNGWGPEKVVTVGRQRMPFGLEALTSSNDISFLERSAITEAYDIGRADGVQLSGNKGDFTYAVAAFEESGGSGSEDDFGAAARVTFAPVNSDGNVLHFGLAHQNGSSDSNATGVEIAGVAGPFHAQAEWIDAEIDDEDADGYYVQLGYVFTGESRPYKGGKFKRIKPAEKCGAFEIVVRYEDGDGDYGDIELGGVDAESLGVGLNWYANNNIRLGMTYTDGESNDNDDEGDEFRTRIQVTF